MPWPSPPPEYCGCGTLGISEIRAPWSPVVRVPRVAPGAGRISITCSWRRKCWAQSCCRCTTCVLQPAHGGTSARRYRRTIRGLLHGQPCPLGGNGLIYPLSPRCSFPSRLTRWAETLVNKEHVLLRILHNCGLWTTPSLTEKPPACWKV